MLVHVLLIRPYSETRCSLTSSDVNSILIFALRIKKRKEYLPTFVYCAHRPYGVVGACTLGTSRRVSFQMSCSMSTPFAVAHSCSRGAYIFFLTIPFCPSHSVICLVICNLSQDTSLYIVPSRRRMSPSAIWLSPRCCVNPGERCFKKKSILRDEVDVSAPWKSPPPLTKRQPL